MDIEPARALAHFTEEFNKQIITVLPGIHCAIGYGLANSILIEGDNGNIIIDTLESREAALELRPDFQSISDKPTVALIYTHNHADHVCGADILAGENIKNVKVFAHATTQRILETTLGPIHPIIFQRAARQFGIYLTRETGAINDGIGLRLKVDKTTTQGFINPTDTFDTNSFVLNIAGREFILYHAPGETDDQIVLYMPKEKVLFAADNIYKAFPNIYAIRGTSTRDPKKWISSLDLMRNLHAEHMIPSHTRPISGSEYIFDVITVYRDAIQFVHDQTVRYMNTGLTIDDIVGNKLIKLPDHLKEHPFLQEFYGTVDWSVRGIFDHYLGWYDGKSSNLNPDSPLMRATNIIQLGGGGQSVLNNAQTAYNEHKYQWCLELTEYLQIKPDDVNKADIDALQVAVLKKLADTQSSANGRNWYLTKSLEVQNLIDVRPSKEQIVQKILKSSLKQIFSLLPIHLNYKKATQMNRMVRFYFKETQEKFQIHIRNSIADVLNDWSTHLSPSTEYLVVEIFQVNSWKQIIARITDPISTLANGEMIIKDSNGCLNEDAKTKFFEFLSIFITE